ncbi:hypothetical protein IMY05_C4255000100 [Salix suchowensis]|nr:hypothetical protein IMY05_C4255000100 [Salix suchowensis]
MTRASRAHGECAYDMPEHTGHSGALKIVSLDISRRNELLTQLPLQFGSPRAITDVTPAAGWVILDCDPHSLDQETVSSAQVMTRMLRVVTTSSTTEDQKTSSSAFLKATGTVSFVFAGANVPGVDGSAVGEGLDARGLFDWISNAFNTVKNAVVNAANAVADAAKAVVKTIETPYPHDVVVLNAQTELPHGCANSVEISLKVEAGGSIDADVKLGLVLGDFAVYAIVDAKVNAHLHAHAYVHGHLDTGRKELLKFPITPIQIQPIFSLGPEIRLDARAELDLAIEVDIDAHLKYDVLQAFEWSGCRPSAYVEVDVWAQADVVAELQLTLLTKHGSFRVSG